MKVRPSLQSSCLQLSAPADHPERELLKLKEIEVMHTVTDKVLVSSSVVQASAAVFKTMKPFLDYLGSILPPMA